MLKHRSLGKNGIMLKHRSLGKNSIMLKHRSLGKNSIMLIHRSLGKNSIMLMQVSTASTLRLFYAGIFRFVSSDGVGVNNFVSTHGQK